MFGALTSFTGGGGLSASSSSGANGDNMFANEFNYKTNASDSGNQTAIIVGVALLAAVFLVSRGR